MAIINLQPRVTSIDNKKAVSGTVTFQLLVTPPAVPVAGVVLGADVYKLQLASLGMPANVTIRSCLVNINFPCRGTPVAPTIQFGTIYFYNPATNELVGITPSTTGVLPNSVSSAVTSFQVTACFPFYAEQNSTIEIMQAFPGDAVTVAFVLMEDQRAPFIFQGNTSVTGV